MKKYFLDLFRGIVSLLDGLLVTLQALFSRPITEPYPRQKADLSPNFRGCLALVQDTDGLVLCTACGLCTKTCPSKCLTVERSADVKRKPGSFRYDISRCSFCGMCVEVCPVSALMFKPIRTRVSITRRNFCLELCPADRHGGSPRGPALKSCNP
jgi:formate hydrogenlyase subunit 6/NADH:ubiquinone oxidoreductase subunit I